MIHLLRKYLKSTKTDFNSNGLEDLKFVSLKSLTNTLSDIKKKKKIDISFPLMALSVGFDLIDWEPSKFNKSIFKHSLGSNINPSAKDNDEKGKVMNVSDYLNNVTKPLTIRKETGGFNIITKDDGFNTKKIIVTQNDPDNKNLYRNFFAKNWYSFMLIMIIIVLFQ
ncbi:hypothetical protein MHBO_001655 [Bonamia ostreae]|uniref:Uncharacterized protein n=1 Tax=Bonamia ostreae TaxID=126728 RepID=A0ABV2AJR4_9EUKA